MKKFLKATIIVAMVLVLVIVAGIYFIDNKKIQDGTYKIVDDYVFPNATIEVNDGNITFKNIDLNKIYRDKLLEIYNKLKDDFIKDISAEEAMMLSDLNAMFVDKEYFIDYSEDVYDKVGTFRYIYPCYNKSIFGVNIAYDAFSKTITVMREGINICFKR